MYLNLTSNINYYVCCVSCVVCRPILQAERISRILLTSIELGKDEILEARRVREESKRKAAVHAEELER